ncbi:MAG: anhydro-N-acetylmuramic acid kinase [Emcibacteraceae bacterium]
MKNGNTELTAIGLMSGTSLDGIDAALIKSDGQSIRRFGRPFHMTYNREQRDQLKAALKEARNAGKPTNANKLINDTEQLITALHAEVVRELLKQNNLKTTDIDVIGFHGQTLLHGPNEGWSWQIGDGEKLSKMLNITVVNDLRRYDVEHGGQGAPMVPVYHQAIVREIAEDFPVGLINFGGVANITWIGGRDSENLLAFDTGPANAMLDDWIRKHTDYIYDQDGKFSKKGIVNREILSGWMKNKYFEIKPPKSLDRDDFNVDEVNRLSLEDGAATLAAFSVEALKVASGQCPQPVKKWYVCGGGAHNLTIMKMLKEALACDVGPISDLGFDGDFIEAEAFAYLAVRHLYNLPITFPGTTGISKPSTGGIVHKP